MKFLTFQGGIHPPHQKKSTEHKSVEIAVQPKIVYIPLVQHIGAPSTALVAKGDSVKKGQKIGEATGFVSSPIHSSVSGIVKSIAPRLVPGGQKVMCVEIENDMQDEIYEDLPKYKSLDDMSAAELLEMVKEAGIVGMGGATFPTHVKLAPPPEKKIDVIILNGAECEPYLTADHRLMLEKSEDIVLGLQVLMKILGVSKSYIGIEDNKMDCVEKMSEAVAKDKRIQVVAFQTKYPQGAEKQLIFACTKREVPSGGLPADIGAVVCNVATAAQIALTLRTGMPLVERICTVTGSCVAEPKNLLIKMGTLYSEIVDQCGGLSTPARKIISGGPMMGIAQSTLDVPATKGSSGILCLTEKEVQSPEASNCIRCAQCIAICPAKIQPMYISAFSLKMNFEKAEEYKALDCIECGSCSFVCPASRPLLQSIRVAKREIMANRRKASK